MLDVVVGRPGAVVAALIAVVIATGNTVAWVGSLAELGRGAQPPTADTRAARATTLVLPALIMLVSLTAAALTPIGTEQLISVCAASQVPLYIVGLAAGLRLLPPFSRPWWLSVLATGAVTTLLIPAGTYLIAPTVIAAGITVRHLAGRASRAGVRVL